MTRVFMSLVPYLIYLFAFTMIPLPESLSTVNSGITTLALSRLIVLGTFIIGLLSGFGAAMNSWEFLPALSKSRRWVDSEVLAACSLLRLNARRRIPSEQEIRTAEEALERIRNDLTVRKAEERRLQSTKVRY